MAEPNKPDDHEQEEKHGVSVADVVRMMVLAWSATLLTVSYLNVVPGMKMDSTFVASLLTGAMAGFGIERKGGNSNQQKKQAPKIESSGASK